MYAFESIQSPEGIVLACTFGSSSGLMGRIGLSVRLGLSCGFCSGGVNSGGGLTVVPGKALSVNKWHKCTHTDPEQSTHRACAEVSHEPGNDADSNLAGNNTRLRNY